MFLPRRATLTSVEDSGRGLSVLNLLNSYHTRPRRQPSQLSAEQKMRDAGAGRLSSESRTCCVWFPLLKSWWRHPTLEVISMNEQHHGHTRVAAAPRTPEEARALDQPIRQHREASRGGERKRNPPHPSERTCASSCYRVRTSNSTTTTVLPARCQNCHLRKFGTQLHSPLVQTSRSADTTASSSPAPKAPRTRPVQRILWDLSIRGGGGTEAASSGRGTEEQVLVKRSEDLKNYWA